MFLPGLLAVRLDRTCTHPPASQPSSYYPTILPSYPSSTVRDPPKLGIPLLRLLQPQQTLSPPDLEIGKINLPPIMFAGTGDCKEFLKEAKPGSDRVSMHRSEGIALQR